MFSCKEILFLERLIGLDWSVVEACMWGSRRSSQGDPEGMNNRIEVNFVIEKVVLVSSGISGIIVDHPVTASSSSGSRQVFLRVSGHG